MSANEPQTLRDEYSRATKILDAEYKPARLDDIIKTSENLHVEEQHQLKELLQKYVEEDYSSEWASPSFAIPKKNGNTIIRVVTDFRKLKLLLKHKMSPISYSKDWES
jgi:hypothetical protein